MFAGLGLDERSVVAVAGLIVNGTAVLILFLEVLRGNREGEYQLLLLFAVIGDEVAAGAMLKRASPGRWVACGVTQPEGGIGTCVDRFV